jgi:hypothetical protein
MIDLIVLQAICNLAPFCFAMVAVAGFGALYFHGGN